MSLSDPDYALVERIAVALEAIRSSAAARVRQETRRIALIEESVELQRVAADRLEAREVAERDAKVPEGGAP